MFYVEQYDRVRRTLVLLTGSRERGEDLTQEVFVRTCQRWEQVRAMEALGAWVHRVAVNLARSEARRGRSELRAREGVRAQRRTDLPAPASADEDLAAALAALPADDRAVVVLRYASDLAVADVARVLDIPEGTVKTRARRRLSVLRAHGLDVDEAKVHDGGQPVPEVEDARPAGRAGTGGHAALLRPEEQGS